VKNIFKPGFRKHFERLPLPLRKKATKAFKRLEDYDQSHFSRALELKHIRGTLYRIRIGDGYRALGYKVGDEMQWDWIGPHDEYLRRIRGL
jgi:mRNA-degrading endonuclease RelE of RelBE toxin-antitoxin system